MPSWPKLIIMVDQTKPLDNNTQGEPEGGLSLKDIWTIVVLRWHWIVLFLIVSLGLAFTYLRYTRPVYATAMKVLIKDNKDSKMRSTSNALDQMGLVPMQSSDGFDNELEILTSTDIATRVVDKLKLYVNYAFEGRIAPTELYRNSPIMVDISPADMARLEETRHAIKMVVTRSGNGIHVKGELMLKGAKVPTAFSGNVNVFPGTLKTPLATLLFTRNQAEPFNTDQRLDIIVAPTSLVGAKYAKSLSAQATSKTTTVAALALNETQSERAIDYLNTLIDTYNGEANEDKNEVARKTEAFLNERIGVIKNELDSTEKNLEQYKRQNELVNLPNNATTALTGTTEYQKEAAEKETELQIVGSLRNYLKNPSNASDVIPVNIGITDQTLNRQIATYNEEIQTLNRLLRTEGNELNPAVTKLNNDIEILWDQIGTHVEEMYQGLATQRQGIEEQHEIYTGKITQTPAQERQLNNYSRQQEVKSGLYLMLLQKREENYISLASVASKARIIDSPKATGQVAPKASVVWLIGLVMGVVLPVAFFWVLGLLRYRIEGRADVEKLTRLDILADIPLVRRLRKGERAVSVRENANGPVEEAFRGLRTSLRFVLTGDEKVIIATSVVPGEGKTFVSTNLAMSLAFMGKRVIIVGLDIRKPQLVRLFGLEDDQRGLTTYLAADEPDFQLLDEQITHGVMNDNLDLLPAGVIPPNPGELISRDLLDRAIEHLRQQYDYVILDTPPIGLVSDTLEMGRLADATLIVARADFSPKSNFEFINAVHNDERLPKMNIVINGIDYKKRKYGYYYGYGRYGSYGHYGQKEYGKQTK